MSDVRVGSPSHAALHFHLLSHLDLGRDAASLYDHRLGRPPWADALLAAVRGSPRGPWLQFLPLLADDLAGMCALIADPALAAAYRVALAAAADSFADDPAARIATVAAVAPAMVARLRPIRDALWAPDPPPSLRILHCPALGRHGRAAGRGRNRVVAVSLDAPAPHPLLQVLHEECHPVSDRTVDARGRETRADAPGYAVHHRLEAAAVALGRRVLGAVDPALSEAYEAWARPFGL